MPNQRSAGVHVGHPRKRIWVQHVAVETDKLEMRVQAARARGTLTESQEVLAQGVCDSIRKARLAAFRDDPIPNRLANWWRGTLVEAAYRRMHTARAQLFDLLEEDELIAEVPLVVARANATLNRDDPRRVTVAELLADTPGVRRARLRRLVGDSYEQLDLEHAQLRSFRNILLSSATFLTLIVIGTLAFVAVNPHLMPLCFDAATPSCPTSMGEGIATPRGADILIVAVLGALGGALAATLSIRNLKGTSTPYDVPVALAALKVPLGALTAILGLVAVQGEFIPGLSELDSQGQILAYALVFGFAQQALSRLLDQQAQTLLEGLPGGTNVAPAPSAHDSLAPAGGGALAPTTPATPPAPGPGDGGDEETDDEMVPAVSAAADRPTEEPDSATQQDQLNLLEDTGNDRQDMTEDEEAELLEAEFGPPDDDGIYGAPPAAPEQPGRAPAGTAPGGP
ncbi:hypothetical protein [uncultured Phycicoccus sp.]|uniref:hypothetical protein n=1 Tax=uncultured Phycicoccus sp. TaxID=661422 RepID=UPI00262D4D56|nr:hypothetical protein [uncultured Phycicoccus sp.]